MMMIMMMLIIVMIIMMQMIGGFTRNVKMIAVCLTWSMTMMMIIIMIINYQYHDDNDVMLHKERVGKMIN